jgi:GntR family transcriptional regulator / MocR family aminotransferase
MLWKCHTRSLSFTDDAQFCMKKVESLPVQKNRSTMNLPLILSERHEISLRSRLKASLIEAIQANRIAAGATLPSSRELANSAGISRATVVRAYEELVRIGYLESRAGGKTYVKEGSRANTQSHNYGDPEELDRGQLGSFSKILLATELLPDSVVDQYDLNYGAPPNWALPLHQWKQILRRNCANLDPLQFEYAPHPFGHMALRKALANYLARTHGVVCSTDQVLTFSDSDSPLHFIAQLFINRGDTVIVESPGHIGARNAFRVFGAEIIAVPMREDGICIETLKRYLDRKIKIIYVTPTFHDPTGICMSLERRRELLRIAEAHNILVVEDGWDSNHSYISPQLTSLQSIAPDHGTFFIYSLWKLLYPLSMTSCLIVPKQFVSLFERAKTLINGVNPVLEHYTLAEFIEAGYLERHLKTVTRQLTIQRQDLIEDLLSEFRASVQLLKQSSAFWLTARFDRRFYENEIRDKVSAMGTKIISTKYFYPDHANYPAGEYLIPFAHRSPVSVV